MFNQNNESLRLQRLYWELAIHHTNNTTAYMPIPGWKKPSIQEAIVELYPNLTDPNFDKYNTVIV